MHNKVVILFLSFLQFYVASLGQAGNPKFNKVYELAKAYGYVRYFYPGDEAAELDWNRFLVYSSKKIIESQESELLLHDLFKTIAPGITISKNRKVSNPNSFQQFSNKLKPVYWQHLGDGNGSIGYPYKSMRMNRSANVLPESQNDFATLRTSLNTNRIAGKEIDFRALFKSDPLINANYSLIIVIKQKNKPAVPVSSVSQEMSTTKWCEYIVKAKIPDSVESVTAVVQSVNMAGTTYVDDVKITVFENGSWNSLLEDNFSNTDTVKLRTNWKPLGINQEFDITHEAKNSYVKIERTKGKKEFVKPLFDYYPEKEWIVKPISKEAKILVPLILQADSLHTYPKSNSVDFSHLKEELAKVSPDELTADNLYCRLSNVIVLWNKIQHFYPEFESLKIDWDVALRNAIYRCFSDMDIFQHRRTLTNMLSGLKDSHMTIYYTSLMPKEYFPPVSWEWVEGKLVIVNVIDTTLNLDPGDVVIKVGDLKASLFWQTAKQNTLGATDSRKNYKTIYESLSGKENTTLEFVVEDGNKKQKSIKLKRTVSLAEFEKLESKRYLESFVEIRSGIFYIDINRLTWSDLKEKMNELEKASTIIIDVRRYPKWQTINLLGHFIEQPVHRLQYGLPVIMYPDREKMKIQYDTASIIYPVTPYLKAKKVFLTGGGAISYAEDVMAIVDYYNIGLIIGEATAGTTGGTNSCYLLGGLQTPWTGISILKQDGKTKYNAKSGVIPGVLVSKTIKNIRSGKDDYLEYLLKHQFK